MDNSELGQWGRFFDGESGQRLEVALHLDRAAETLRLSHPDLPHGSQYWPFRAIRALADQAREDQLILSLYDDGALDSALITTARLTVDDPGMIQELKSRCRNLKRKDLKEGTGRKIVVRAGAAIGAIALMILVILPAMASTLARLIPIEREIAYGKSVVGQMERFLGGSEPGALLCSNPDGLVALNAMEDRLLKTTDTIYDLNIVVFNHRMVNAFAAPGGQIVIMRGLLDKAQNADEVAAVLAHEIGHVEARDVTRNALRAAGSAGLLSMVLGDFAGGSAVVLAADHTLNASYTRAAEAQADVYGMNMLRDANVNVRAMSGFFQGLSDLEGKGPKVPSYLRSHPETSGRAQAAREFAQGQIGTRSVISDKHWADLKNICS
ncbi:MAG: M48 family metallopeptidase [Paracoccaceae bacterium]